MIQNLKLYFILNTRGSNALLVKMWTRSGCYQAGVSLEDSDAESLKEMRTVFSKIRPNFIGLNEEDWVSFDAFLSQLDSKSTSIDPSLSLALSLACARAATQNELWKIMESGTRFPYIMGTVALGKDWKEFMLIPHRERTVLDAFNSLKEVWKVTGDELKEKGFLRGMSGGGAWLSGLGDLETLYFIAQIANDWDMRLGINVGGTSLWDGKVYNYKKSKGSILRKNPSPEEQMSLLLAVAEQYKIYYIEDPFHGSDFMSHAYLTQKLEDRVISGCELYNGDIARIKRGCNSKATNAVSLDSTHLFSLSQLQDISEFVRGKGLKLVLSKSGRETGDTWISDLSVGLGADMLKLGIMGAENIAKYNRLLEIWEDMPAPRMGRTDLSG